MVYREYLVFFFIIVLCAENIACLNLSAVALEVTEMEKKRSKWKRQHSEDSKDNMLSDRALRCVKC